MPIKHAYIKGTNEQYKITSNGKVWSLYRYRNKGVKVKQLKQISIYQVSKINKSPALTLYLDGRTKTFYLLSLMIKAFDIMPPDNMHHYDLKHKDGDIFNNKLSNLKWKIRSCNREFAHYPQPFYKKGVITEKICSSCGIRRPITDFYLLKPKKPSQPSTYRNDCNKCRGVENWARIKKDPAALIRMGECRKRFKNSEKGKLYYATAHKETYKRYRQIITKNYAAYIMRLSVSELPDDIYELKKEQMKLNRLLKNLKNQEK